MLLFCFFGVLSGFCGLRKNYFPFTILYSWRLLFSLRFFLVCSIFLSANGAAVVIDFFLALVSAVLFCCFCSPFAFLSLPFFRVLLLTTYLRLLHVLVVLLGLFCPFYMHNWCLEILVYMSVLWAFCCTRFGFPLLFSPPCFLYIFFVGLKPFIYALCARPSTSRPPVSLALLCPSCVFCMHNMTEFIPAPTSCVALSLIPVT